MVLRELDRPKESLLPSTIVYAGASPKRTALLEMLLEDQGTTLLTCPFPFEPNDQDAGVVAQYKRVVALSELGLPPDKSLVIAADTQTSVVLEDGRLLPRNKPRNPEEILANFRAMETGAYEVNAATVFFNDGQCIEDSLRCRVGLRGDVLAALQTRVGLAEYCRLAQQFYSEPPYSTSGFPPMGLKDMSGGISLPVLRRMDGIESINGSNLLELPSDELHDVLKEALFTVAVGLSPRLLERINPKARQIIYNWSWLTQTTDKLV
ncbi:MAG TPA: hypothetical protein VMW29_03685 [Candidatus Bathyarchaeia archaeon]|nr:hypothetical protein [Candidatus Bathyarchaeia archaeon]